MQLMLKAHDTLFRVWELAVSFLGLPPLIQAATSSASFRSTTQIESYDAAILPAYLPGP